MKLYIRTIIATVMLALTMAGVANANHTTPAAANEVPEAFVERAYENARNFSPFAAAATAAEAASSVHLDLAAKMTDYAASFLGTRYRLGASGPKAFDCSGFTSYVFRNFGITLSRTSRQQYTQGERVATDELQPGDLMFFSSRSSGKGNVGHVGIVVEVNNETGSCTFIHASTKRGVVYQKFPDGGYYQKHYIGAKRILGTADHDMASL